MDELKIRDYHDDEKGKCLTAAGIEITTKGKY